MPRTYSAMHLYRSSVGRSGRSPCRLHTLATLFPIASPLTVKAIIPSIIKLIGTSCLFIVAMQSTRLFIYCRRAIDTPVCLLSPRLIDTWIFIYCRRFIDLTVYFLSPFYRHHCLFIVAV